MNKTIHIPEPCSESWALMKDAGKGKRHCEMCRHHVYDFTACSRAEIDSVFDAAKGQKVCGRYHERHTSADNKFYRFLNNIENRLIALHLKRTSAVLIAVALILSSCARRHREVMGAYTIKAKDKVPQKTEAKI